MNDYPYTVEADGFTWDLRACKCGTKTPPNGYFDTCFNFVIRCMVCRHETRRGNVPAATGAWNDEMKQESSVPPPRPDVAETRSEVTEPKPEVTEPEAGSARAEAQITVFCEGPVLVCHGCGFPVFVIGQKFRESERASAVCSGCHMIGESRDSRAEAAEHYKNNIIFKR